MMPRHATSSCLYPCVLSGACCLGANIDFLWACLHLMLGQHLRGECGCFRSNQVRSCVCASCAQQGTLLQATA